jgi:hypothetical protein
MSRNHKSGRTNLAALPGAALAFATNLKGEVVVNDAWGITEDDQPTDGPKALREAYKNQKSQNDELMKRLAALEAQAARNSAADILESQGVARSAAKYYTGEADPEKVTAWANDLRSAFGAPVPTDQTTSPVLNATDQEQYQRMMQAGQGGTTMGNVDAAKSSIHDAKTPAELIAAFQNLNI